jgi:hypothetical protein
MRPPNIWELPDGYRSWVVVEYERPSCPALPLRDGHRVHRIGADGRLCTSDRLLDGPARERFMYIKPDGSLEEILIPGYTGQFRIEGVSNRLFGFIGTREEQQRALDSAPPGYLR